jgi:aminoglycoside 2''-phosphotransferase
MDLSLYVERIRECFPTLTISAVRFNPDGLTNHVFIVNDELVFRFPKNEQAKQALDREAQVLDLVRRHVSLPVPYFERQEEDFVMYRFLPGQPLYRHDLLRQDNNTQDQIAEQLATFLQQLHTIPQHQLQAAGLTLAPAENRTAYWRQRLQEFEQELHPFLWADQKAWIHQLFTPLLEGTLDMMAFLPALVHDDLASYHILYDPTTCQLSGVIDFGVAGLGDPADDFALIINTCGESFLRRMARFYPEILPALDRARFKAGALELEWALNGVRANDPNWFLVHLGRARDVLPIHT